VNCLTPFRLRRFDDADEPRRHDAPDHQRFLGEHHDIDRIAVVAERSRDEPEIDRERGSGRENPIEHDAS
jgi:hypothetical protein